MVSLFQNVPSKPAGTCWLGASMVEMRLAVVGAFTLVPSLPADCYCGAACWPPPRCFAGSEPPVDKSVN